MEYYDIEENVDQYIRMAAGYDGTLLIDVLRKHLPEGSKVLELGMGVGKDLLLLKEYYQVSGSDSSRIFVERFKRLHPDIDVRHLDAITMTIEERYDGIYSNKVLYHLRREELKISLGNQAHALKTDGIMLHSFWWGDGEGDHQGLHFEYYNEVQLTAMVGADYEVLDSKRYSEIEAEDSFYVVLRKQ